MQFMKCEFILHNHQLNCILTHGGSWELYEPWWCVQWQSLTTWCSVGCYQTPRCSVWDVCVGRSGDLLEFLPAVAQPEAKSVGLHARGCWFDPCLGQGWQIFSSSVTCGSFCSTEEVVFKYKICILKNELMWTNKSKTGFHNNLIHFFEVQATLFISKSRGPDQILRVISSLRQTICDVIHLIHVYGLLTPSWLQLACTCIWKRHTRV